MRICIPGIAVLLFILSGCSKLEEGSQNMNPVVPGFHPNGWASPASPSFHGRAIADSGFTMASCKSCHGSDYRGGTTTVSCYTCHARGPESCNTCHGSSLSIAPPVDLDGDSSATSPGVGAHQSHVRTSAISGVFKCSTCHPALKGFSDPAHINPSNPEATIAFTDPIAHTPSDNKVIPNPAFDPDALSCSGTYCHGAFDGGNQNNAPVWNASDQAKCGTCHGNPVTGVPTPTYNHPQGSRIDQNCGGCHYTVDSTGTRHPVAEQRPDGTYVVDIPSVHVNGLVNLVGGAVPIDARKTTP